MRAVSELEDLLVAAMSDLAKRRPLFHGEADFQLALAWEIQTLRPTAHIRLEKRVLDSPRIELDALVQVDEHRLGLELKYPRAALTHKESNERFVLVPGAPDLERYDFLKDIARLERLCVEKIIDAGCALMLTNSPTFWAPGTTRTTAFEQFRFDEGRTVSGSLAWGSSAGRGTRRDRDQPVQLRGSYTAAWRDYASVGGARFRYLAVLVC